MMEYETMERGDREELSREEINNFILYLMNDEFTEFHSVKEKSIILIDNDMIDILDTYTVKVFRYEYLEGKWTYEVNFMDKVSGLIDYECFIDSDVFYKLAKKADETVVKKERAIINSIKRAIKK